TVARSTLLAAKKRVGVRVAVPGVGVGRYDDGGSHPIALVLDGFQGQRSAERNAENDERLLRLSLKPLDDGPQIVDVLRHRGTVGAARRRVAASALLPVADEEILFQVEQPLKLSDLVQDGQTRAPLNDEQRRKPSLRGTHSDFLPGAVDVELRRLV